LSAQIPYPWRGGRKCHTPTALPYVCICVFHTMWLSVVLHVWFASWIIVRFMEVLWLELLNFSNLKYCVCVCVCRMSIVFIFSSDCSCVYIFGLQSHQFLKTISAQPLHNEVLILAICWHCEEQHII
jgi:hypothetical protein